MPLGTDGDPRGVDVLYERGTPVGLCPDAGLFQVHSEAVSL